MFSGKEALTPAERDNLLRALTIPITGYLRRYCGDTDAARDLLQETLIRIDRALPNFDGRSKLKTWAFTIATRTAADHYRKAARQLPTAEDSKGTDAIANDHTLEQQLVIDEMDACVRDVIDSLPEDYRTALVLRDLEGFSLAEVAEISDCSVATAKVRVHRARKRLKEALDVACNFYHDEEDVLRCDRSE